MINTLRQKQIAIFIGGSLVLVGVAALTLGHAYAQGFKAVRCDHPLGLGLGAILIVIQLLLLLALCAKLGKQDIFAYAMVIALIEPPQLLLFHDGARQYASCVVLSGRAREVSDLRSIAVALESYLIDWSEYPCDLDRLTTTKDLRLIGGKMVEGKPYLASLPRPRFGNDPAPRYAAFVRPDYVRPVATRWILWTPGPDGRYSIHPGPELDSALAQIDRTGAPGAWLIERIYDPTNGSTQGDIIRLSGGREVK